MATKNRGLGKGLDAIFAENTVETGGAVTIRLSEIEPNRNQPRKEFDEASLSELADSIAEHGLLQPILVRPLPDGGAVTVSVGAAEFPKDGDAMAFYKRLDDALYRAKADGKNRVCVAGA